jgi:hypothetical protein
MNTIWCNEINACATSLEFRDPPTGSGILANDIKVIMNHLSNVPVLFGEPGAAALRDNHISMSVEAYIGLRIFGNNNFIELLGTQIESGPEIIFEADARDNIVRTTSPLKSVLDKSKKATNRILSCAPVGCALETPAFPASGTALVNRTAYVVEAAILKPGAVSSWEETDANGSTMKFDAGLSVGQHFTVEPGDSVKFQYTQAPVWRWKGLQ